MNLLTHFLGFPNPFTSFLPLIILMGLLLHSLGFLSPFAYSLLLIIFVGLLTTILVIPVYWALLYYFLFSFSSYCWVSFVIGSFVKSGPAIVGKLDFCYLFLAKIQICSIHFGNSQFGLCYFKLIVSSILTVNSLGTN